MDLLFDLIFGLFTGLFAIMLGWNVPLDCLIVAYFLYPHLTQIRVGMVRADGDSVSGVWTYIPAPHSCSFSHRQILCHHDRPHDSTVPRISKGFQADNGTSGRQRTLFLKEV